MLTKIFIARSGANVGLFSLQAARVVGRTGSVLAVEALPPTYKALEANMVSHASQHVDAKTASVTTVLCAVCDTDNGHLDMTFYPRASGAVFLCRIP